MDELPAQYARRAEQSQRRLKGKTIAIWSVCLMAVLGSIYTYRQVPGYFHAYWYDHETFRDCADCPEMVVVPPGRFLMGSNQGSADERPPVQITIDYAFAVGIYEVTQAE